MDELLDSIVDHPPLNLDKPTVDQIVDEVLKHSEDKLVFKDNYQKNEENMRNLTDIVRVYTLKCYISKMNFLFLESPFLSSFFSFLSIFFRPGFNTPYKMQSGHATLHVAMSV